MIRDDSSDESSQRSSGSRRKSLARSPETRERENSHPSEDPEQSASNDAGTDQEKSARNRKRPSVNF